ncbi:hypothetical protein [Salinilacihabitans rarus]|uniref:hypothetical protein n=1 Tax=Salinilacihabitans rarus TaxID=2961596 RepID=UPI0020C930F4|nr:hypothetical protein [Salinilacihabitans rarus]
MRTDRGEEQAGKRTQLFDRLEKFVQRIRELTNLLSVDFSRVPDDDHILLIGMTGFINFLNTFPNPRDFNLVVFGVVVRFTTIYDYI